MAEEPKLKPKSSFEMVVKSVSDTEYLSECVERFRKTIDNGEVVIVTISFRKE